MKRSVKSVCKFCLMGIVTIFTTVVIFHHIRPPKDNNHFENFRGVAPVEKLVRSRQTVDIRPNLVLRSNAERIDWHNYEQIEEEKQRTG